MTIWKKSLFPAVLSLLWLMSFSVQADWPMFHGPEGTNRSRETGLLPFLSEEGPKLLWKTGGIGEKQSGFSSVTISRGRLFTAGSRGGRSFVYCFDSNGGKLWEYENGGVWTKSYAGARSTPTVDGDYVYDLSSLGRLVCLDTGNGREIWARNIFDDFRGENTIWGIAESVRIDGDRLICSPGGAKASVVALDKRTGTTLWTTPSTGEKTSYASATIFRQDDLRILAMMYAKGLLGIDIETGELLFSYIHTQRYDINCSRPIYHDGHLFIVNAKTPPDNNGAVLLKVIVDGKAKKAFVEKVWQNRDFDNLHDAVLLQDGYLYGSSHEYKGGVFMCVDWKTGKTVYESREPGRGAFTFADGLLYYLNERGEFRLIRPNPEKYDPRGRWTLPDEGEGPYWAHPVIHDKKLYLRHGEFLYCYTIDREDRAP